MLREIQPAWPGSDVFVEARYKDSAPREISEDKFLDELGNGNIKYLGDWQSPAGPARRFFFMVQDHQMALSITTKLAAPRFYMQLPSRLQTTPAPARVKLRR